MQHRSLSLHVLLATGALLAAAPAHALSTASSKLANLGILVTDITPGDGLAPSVSFSPQVVGTAVVTAVTSGGVDSWEQDNGNLFEAVSVAGALGGTGGWAAFSGEPRDGSGQLTASAQGVSDGETGTAEVFFQPPWDSGVALTLGAYTQITFQGDATLDWSAGTTGSISFAEIDLALWLEPSGDVVARDEATAGYGGNDTGSLAGSAGRRMTVTYANDTPVPVTLAFQVSSYASAAELPALPLLVPEPAGVGLMLAGMSMVLWGLRRR